jgi:DNA helicase II / ATP-dependent DNA helicase PcrA
MADRLTLAVAGSGKTHGLAEYCATLPRERSVIAVTFTQFNQAELRSRIAQVAGDRLRIRVSGWFAFLLRDFATPFVPFLFPGRRIRGFNFDGRPSCFAKGAARFFDASGAAYSCELGRLSSELTDASEGALRRRLECCYDEVLIDEVQDLAAHDWEILDFLLDSDLTVTMVGDFRQALLSTNPRSAKNRPYAQLGAIEWFREREAQGRLTIVESNLTWRCRPEIATFSDSIYARSSLFSPTVAKNDMTTGHDGVFWVHPDDVTAYVERFAPQCLRDSVASGKAHNLDYLNFGEAKGTAYERVLIVPTGPIAEFVKTGADLKPTSAARFYVAVTRAAQSVALVLDGPGVSELPHWQPDG